MRKDILDRYELLRKKRFEFCEAHNIIPKKLVSTAKELMLIGRTSKDTINLNKMNAWSDSQYYTAIGALRYIFEEIYDLSPEKIDALWRDEDKEAEKNFLNAVGIKGLVDKIVSESPSKNNILKDCLFNKKKIILKLAYPDYYKATYREKYDVIEEVLNATGTTYKDLLTAARSKNLVSNNKSMSMGKEVDNLIMEALEANFKAREKIIDYKDKLTFLAAYKKNHLNSFSIYKILNQRGCYSSLLDFYYLNSSVQNQIKYFNEYIELRDKYQKEDCLSEIIKTIDNNQEDFYLDLDI